IGVPKALEGTAIPFPYGDLNALGELLDNHRDQIAAVMMEPVRSEEPPPGYLEGVAKLARQHGAVLIFDEVSCGFRIHIGAAQAYYGVTPDMAVFPQAVAEGYPIGGGGGRRGGGGAARRQVWSTPSLS